MRVRFLDRPSVSELRSLKPCAGDLVSYQGVSYRALAVGLRYIRMSPVGGDGKTVCVAKVCDVVKVGPGPTAEMNYQP